MKYTCEYCNVSYGDEKTCRDCENKCKLTRAQKEAERQKSADNVEQLKLAYLKALDTHKRKYSTYESDVVHVHTIDPSKQPFTEADLKRILSKIMM